MNESRAGAPIFVLLIIISGVFTLAYFDKVDIAAAALETAKVQAGRSLGSIRATEQMLAARTALKQQNQAFLTQLQLAERRLNAAEKIIATADNKQLLIASDLRNLVDSVKAITAQRLEAIKETELHELQLRSGEILRKVRLRKFDDALCSFVHSDGIGSMPMSELPLDLLEQLNIGPESILGRLHQFEIDMGLAAPLTTAGRTKKEPLNVLFRRAAELESRIAGASAHLSRLESEVNEYDISIMKEQTLGNPTFNIRSMRDVAVGNAGLARLNLTKLETDLKKLHMEMQALSQSQP
jgi:hypothetical protein